MNLLAAVVALGCAGYVATQVASAPRTEAGLPATPAQRAMFAANIAGGEDGWRRQAETEFPSDLWSQRDSFHGHEAQSVRDLGSGTHVPYEEVIRAIDEDVHRTGRMLERSSTAVRCKPRPFYD